MKPLVETSEKRTRLRLFGASPRLSHFIVSLAAFVLTLAALYLTGIAEAGVALGLALVFGFVLVWGLLSYRAAQGAVIEVSEQELTLPPAATGGSEAHVLARHELRDVSLIQMRSRRGHKTQAILEIQLVDGEKLRLWPTMVLTHDLARAIQRHMGLTVQTRSGLRYQLAVGLLVLAGLAVLVYLFYL